MTPSLITDALSISLQGNDSPVFVDSPERITFSPSFAVTATDCNGNPTEMQACDTRDAIVEISFSDQEKANNAIRKASQSVDEEWFRKVTFIIDAGGHNDFTLKIIPDSK